MIGDYVDPLSWRVAAMFFAQLVLALGVGMIVVGWRRDR